MRAGALVISLDFELYWGIGDHIDYNKYRLYFDNTIETIPAILNLFVKHNIHCTWATVGMLWNESWEEWQKNIPSKLPDYHNPILSNYRLEKKITFENVNNTHFFALNVIKSIQAARGQEIGSHTYSHYYCGEKNRSLKVFSEDLRKATEIALKTQTKLESLVLPRNQFIEEILDTMKTNNIKSVRTNPDIWYWRLINQNKKSSRIARLIDSYFSLFREKCYPWSQLNRKQGVLLQPASRFLRPINKRFFFFNKLRINRIKKEMTYAAENNEIYHLWWHPHNFALKPKLALEELEEILNHYQFLNNKFKFKSLNMREIYEEYNSTAG